MLALNKLGENNQVLIRRIPAHSGYLGYEKADTLAKRGADYTDAALLKLLIPKATWNVAIIYGLNGKMHLRSTSTTLKWFAQRNAVFDSFYLNDSGVVDNFSIFAIMNYMNATGCADKFLHHY